MVYPSEAQISENRDRFLGMIERGISPLDGVMSPLSIELLKKFAVDAIDMTELWAFTPQDWECPGCGRSKRAIARLNSKGQLMCRLVDHHDHMQDLLVKKFAEISAARDEVVADATAQRFAKRSAAMVSAYDRTIVCNDCNNADTKAKKLVDAPDDFSFSPRDIRTFVISRENVDHDIDAEKAQACWLKQQDTFKLRLTIVRRIAEIAASNEHWYQESALNDRPETVRRRAHFLESVYQASGVLTLLCGEKRTPPPKLPCAWRQMNYPNAKHIPTAGDISHIAKVTHAKAWASIPDDWKCPCCGREKRHTVRKSDKTSAWVFHLGDKLYRDPSVSKGYQNYILCGDCGWVAEQLGREAVARAGAESQRLTILVEPREVSLIVVPRPHARHLFKNEVADIVVDKIVERISQHS